MTTSPAPAKSRGLAAPEKTAARRPRASYRRQLTAAPAANSTIEPDARRKAAIVLEVLAGMRTPAAAASALAIRLPRYYLLEERAIKGLIAACQARPRGRTVSTDRQLARVQRELAVSQRELARHQALARTTQRILGVLPAPSIPKGKPQPAAGTPKRRNRKPAVRALRAARLLGSVDSPGGGNGPAVQEAPESRAAPGSAIEPKCIPATADQGGSHHAGRAKAVEHR